ncbi:dihydropteroate synthase [Prochlorococcus marinus]|uniref:Dihydropteroate synthase n=1 Tax=Prochlorococcus marinus XMU1408 TaxID=2213228 RepID=A0A318R6G4_PROMR|nr:dihydropteroate synthase [Prochlorococcus marinus]MBW3042011.1 dihydropteroate synthase [Prochlorococcus marinus str. XMU1408]PYE03298.1 dihydropteroate synthase [Prochlorococcus marinus XMU1408]
MAIINITNDSFSDGGLFVDLESAINHACLCIKKGAQILDIGAQSTRPGASEVGAEVEINRLIPLIKELKLMHPHIPISVDTYHHSVASKALNAGADCINDISGGRHDPEIFKVISDFSCPYILMHSRGNSKTMDSLTNYKNIVIDVKNELSIQIDSALSSGVNRRQIIIDPGIGFAKTVEQNLILLRNLELFDSMEFPILIGASRKRFIGSVINEIDPIKRIFGMAAIASRCVIAGVNFLRVHDVKQISQVIKMTNSII